jgi:hypothetical protein
MERNYYRAACVEAAVFAALFLRELLSVRGWVARLTLGALFYGLLGLLWWEMRRCHRLAERRRRDQPRR